MHRSGAHYHQHITQGIVTRMKVNISTIIFGTVAISAIALPAQAAMVNRTTTNPNGGGTISAAAYSINGLDVTGFGTYDVTFKYGTYNNVFAGDPNSVAGTLATPLSNAILGILGQSDQVISTFANLTSGPQTSFFIPKALVQAPNGNDVMLDCSTFSDSCTSGERAISQRGDDSVLFATWKTATVQAPTGSTPVPTPALIPGLLGMGLAALRKKQQAA
jgi:hypothetical protein